jgi:squalene-hopene/tetraprenyl-beta-curcumene cyclase
MTGYYRGLVFLAIVTGVPAMIIGCRTQPSHRVTVQPSRVEQIDRSLAEASRFLTARQASDGSWRSDTYPAFKDGASLTPLVLHALLSGPNADSTRRGVEFLSRMVLPDGTIKAAPDGISYPVYTAALAVIVLGRSPDPAQQKARDAWLTFLRDRQLTEALGWQPPDKEFGGWGYCRDIPRKPKPGESPAPLTESNLSATALALEALRSTNCPSDDPALKNALVFVQRCQNFSGEANRADVTFDDGGFFFIYDDGARNKAGPVGKDTTGRERFASYGSTTADGLLSLLLGGLPANHPRALAARSWLEKNFSVTTHPGKYAAPREGTRQAVYYYYCWSLAKALSKAGVQEINTSKGTVRWAEALADELLKRQDQDGSWVNAAVDVREDDPLTATSLAAEALTLCRQVIGGDGK